ncbi:hypothetical protein [Gorillibacterium massiliense]|uniref:hypothetical protein n=1 Tax=Gorillibacterium massiliense TaxID=1280390 RepID=UPI0004AE8A5C|nr:hypothetical protein [Gorillibacterium massiliense]
MEKFRDYMDKLKHSANQLIGPREDEEPDRKIELEERDFALLMTWAERKNTDVKTLVDEAVRQYITARTSDKLAPIPEERKERNPLLALDGLTQMI